MNRKTLVAALMIGTLALPLWASEVDSFTGLRPLRDAAPLLNEVVNVWMEQAMNDANEPTLLAQITGEAAAQCDSDRLISSLNTRLAGYLIGEVERFANESTSIDKIKVPFEQSIYRDFEFTESPTIRLTKRLGVLLRIGDVHVGSDKFGHFFSEGYSYYELYTDDDPHSAIEYGKLTEETYYGELTTGVFSYADLVANINGLRFWNAVLGRQTDPITPDVPVKPYFACREGLWYKQRRFDWLDYVDPAWDEAVNCDAFRDRNLLEKADRRIREATGGLRCPLHPAPIPRLQRKYGRLLATLFNPDGNRVNVEDLQPGFIAYWESILSHRSKPGEAMPVER